MFHLATILLIFLALHSVSPKNPPIYNYSYFASFDQTNVAKSANYTVGGQQFYDPLNNRQRVDFINGRYDRFCGTIIPNVNTPCQQITTGNRRWIVFPDKHYCCFCCDSAHGCGIVTPNWLQGGEYVGEERIGNGMFDKWSKNEGGKGNSYLWVTQDSANIPRKLDEDGKIIRNYQTEFFEKQTFPESVFSLPAYCDVSNNCPLQSTCGTFRLKIAAK